MTDGYQPNRNLEEYAARLLAEDRVMDAAKSLEMSLRCAAPLKTTCVLLPYMMDNCCRHQYPKIVYLFEEFGATLPPAMEAPLRMKEHAMHVRFGNPSEIGRASC